MDQPAVVHSTFALSRSYPQPPERVFAALSDPAKKRRWYAEDDHHDVLAFESDFRVGGAESLRYRLKPGTPFPGAVITSDGTIQDIVPGRRVVIASSMAFGERRISAHLVTFELISEAAGTKLVCTFQGAFFEGSDGPKIREAGWRALLEKLSAEVSR